VFGCVSSQCCQRPRFGLKLFVVKIAACIFANTGLKFLGRFAWVIEGAGKGFSSVGFRFKVFDRKSLFVSEYRILVIPNWRRSGCCSAVSKVRSLTDDEQTMFALLKKLAYFLLVGVTPATRKRTKGMFKSVKKVNGYNVLRVCCVSGAAKRYLLHSVSFP
jgi:hypothetical protein